MILLHYLLPLAIYYFYRNRVMLWGLLSANIIDLDHIYMRIVGKVPWFGTACEHFGQNCSFQVYPLHNWAIGFAFLALSPMILAKDKKLKFIGWFGLGIFIHLILDYIAYLIGFQI